VIRSAALALGRAVGGMRRRKAVSFLCSGAVALGLALVAVTMWLGDNVSSWSAHWNHGVDMVLYLDRGIAPERITEISDALSEIDAVEAISAVSPEQALTRLRAELGGDVLAGIDASALAPSLEISLSAGTRDAALAHPVVERLRGIDGVDDVELMEGWVDELLTVSTALDRATAALMLLSLLACVYVIFVTMRLRARDSREEARVYELFAAGGRFVRGPLVAEGLLHGVFGALLAISICALIHRAASPLLAQLSVALFGTGDVVFLSPHRMAAIVATGVVAGTVGSVLATGRRVLS